MGNNQTEKAFEEKRLAQTISLAEEQLKQAKEGIEQLSEEPPEAKELIEDAEINKIIEVKDDSSYSFASNEQLQSLYDLDWY